MANPLPNEKELYERIKNEEIAISPGIWDLLYNRIGDDISAINLLCQYYLNERQSIPALEAKKILSYTRHIKNIVNDITLSSKEKFPFPEFLDSVPLHPILREMFTHYIGNDVYGINLIVGCYVDLKNPEPIPLEDVQKIINHTRTIKEFMNRLKDTTSYERNILGPKEAPSGSKLQSQNKSVVSTKQDIFLKVRTLLAKEFVIKEEKIKLESHFIGDLGLDSVDAIEVVMVIEDAFSFEIPDEETEKILTVAQLVDYIFSRLNSQQKKKRL
jgi:acyl carrier protein